jgi:hypothetical protein
LKLTRQESLPLLVSVQSPVPLLGMIEEMLDLVSHFQENQILWPVRGRLQGLLAGDSEESRVNYAPSFAPLSWAH